VVAVAAVRDDGQRRCYAFKWHAIQSMRLAQSMSDIFKDIILSLQMECQMEIRRFTAVIIPHEGGEEGPGTLNRQQSKVYSVLLLGWFEVQRIVQRNEVVIDITSAFPYACPVIKGFASSGILSIEKPLLSFMRDVSMHLLSCMDSYI